MSDKVVDILQLAIQSAGTVEDYYAWRQRVLERATAIAGMLNEHSLEHYVTKRVLDGETKDSNTSVFMAIYRGYEYEQSSTRLKVHLANVSTGEMEKDLRTDRTDEMMGAVMRARLDGIKPGTKVRAWKHLENFGTVAEPKRFRVLAHIEPMSKRDEDPEQSQPPAPSAAAAVPAPTTGAAPPPSEGSAPSGGGGIPSPSVKEALSRLSGPQRLRVAKAAAQDGILDMQTATPEQSTRLLILIEQEIIR